MGHYASEMGALGDTTELEARFDAGFRTIRVGLGLYTCPTCFGAVEDEYWRKHLDYHLRMETDDN